MGPLRHARSTATTPFTFFSACITLFSCVRSEHTNVKTFTARPSSPARQLASLMLIPCALKVCPTVARMPGPVRRHDAELHASG